MGRVQLHNERNRHKPGNGKTGAPPPAPYTYGPITENNDKDNAIVGGFTVGLGMDVAILPNVFLRGEWEFVGFAQVNGIRTSDQYRPCRRRHKVLAPERPPSTSFPVIAAVDRAFRLDYLRQWDTPPQRGAPIWKDRL